ncbi:sulfatase [Tichowtungia aerotolerans]|uniref:Sulfatase-like hydrolase/transferase n=1 Tax=Tichowtungia aerotolerans TaxID=2697043 RepID=A0A6P1MDK7_9BACT|nr:sulfatase [Tichowtungia aerotolerans]QHI70158.1 sulfatase-like hydrolase/transferase [Tichowtungia aerotolerans]
MKKKNVLFIISHDISNRFGCLGDAHAVTPSIDRLAEHNSLVFEKHYCHWPLCGPSRANLFSGCRPMTTERFSNAEFWETFHEKMGPDYATMPQHFKNNGYFTRSFWQVFHDTETDPESWSVPQWFPPMPKNCDPEIPPADWNDQRHWVAPESQKLIMERIATLKKEGKKLEGELRRFRGPGVECADVDDSAYPDGKTTDEAVRAIEEYDRAQPFFMAVGYEIGHTPWCAPKKYWDLYNREKLTIPGAADQPPGTPTWGMGDKEPAQYYWQHSYDQVWHPTYEQEKEMMHGHYACISFYDAQVGRLVDAIEKKGLRDDTIIVVTTDHGFTIGEHGYWGKHNMWEPSFHIPLVISVPGYGSEQKTTRQLTEHVDLYPTLCDLCYLDKPDYLEGDSLVPLMEVPSRAWKKAVFSHRMPQFHDLSPDYKHGRTVRTDRYRYTLYEGVDEETVYEELFDYDHDPGETTNLAQCSEHARIKMEMKQLLQDGWEACRV